MRRCANCRYFKPLGYMSKVERRAFIDLCGMIGVDNYDEYGYCTRLPMWRITSKNGVCNWWEVKKE